MSLRPCCQACWRWLPLSIESLACLAVAISIGTASGANKYWAGASGTTNSPTSGTWQTSTPVVWSDGPIATANAGWPAGDTAFFGGAGGTCRIQMAGAIAATSLAFSASGYTLTNSTPQTITLSVIGGSCVSVASGKTAILGTNVTLASGVSGTTLGASAAGVPGGTLIFDGGSTFSRSGNYSALITGVGTVVSLRTNASLLTSTGTTSLLAIGSGAGDNVTLSVDGGLVSIQKSTASIWIPNNVSGSIQGTLSLNSGLVAGTGGFVSLGAGAGTFGTLNLNGGTLMINALTGGGATGTTGLGTGIVNFNGGTLTAFNGNNGAQFVTGLSAAYIRDGGLVLDDNGFDLTIAQVLKHTTNKLDSPLDGGLLKLGPGTLTLSATNSYTGATTISNGTLALAGSISGPVAVLPAGTLAGGNSIGTICISNNLTLAGLLNLRIDKSSSLTNDTVRGVTNLTYGGTLVLSLTNGTWTAGDAFTLFTAKSYSGAFARVVATPSLSAGLTFNTSSLALNGTLRVVTDSSAPLFQTGILPAASTLLVGGSITFSTSVSGATPMSYQWRCNGTNIPSANSPSLTLSNLGTGNSGTYTLVASNSLGTATNSQPAFLTVRAVDDFDRLLWAWRDYFTGGTNLDLSDPIIASWATAVGNSANTYWNSLNKSANRTYLWSDAASTTDSAAITTGYYRLSRMAQGWGTIGSPVYGNADLASDIMAGLDWMYTYRYNETQSEYDNWWDWEIGAPNDLNNAVAVLYPLLSGTQITNYCNAIDHFSPTVNLTADNRVWKAEVVGVRGVIGRSAAKVVAARDGLSDISGGGAASVFNYVTSNDGFYRDGSFIQHHKYAYTGGYGLSLLGDIVKLADWLRLSPWVILDPQQTNVTQWCYASFEPLIYNGAMPDFVAGRGISRSGSSDYAAGHGAINAMFRKSLTAPTNDALRLESMVKYWAQADATARLTSYVDIDLIPVAEQLLADTNIMPRGELVGHYRFPSMDRVMHLRPGFGFGLSLFSARICNYESINGENYHGWFTGYGMNYLYTTNDPTQFSDNYWPTIDPYHLPGTTVDLPLLANSANAGKTNAQYWVGGCSLSNAFGVTGMSLADVGGSLVGKKSWFMFDDEVVCLGAGISDNGVTNVHTTVENRRLNSAGNNLFIVNGNAMPGSLGWSSNLTQVSWCALANCGGYYFPGGANLSALRQARTGAWSDINVGGSGTAYTRNYLALIWDHGVKPVNAGYAYVLLPNYTTAAVSQYATNPQVTIVTNSPAVQAVREISLGILAANFWTNDSQSVDILTATAPCSVMTCEAGGALEVDVSDPTWTNTGSLALTCNRTCTGVLSADPGVTVVQTNPILKLSVNVNGAHGKTFQARFTLPYSGPPTLTGAWDRTGLVLNWSGGMLLQATNVLGPWTTNLGATPPLRVDTSKGQMFYRAKAAP
jgi:hyaluronate lyase